MNHYYIAYSAQTTRGDQVIGSTCGTMEQKEVTEGILNRWCELIKDKSEVSNRLSNVIITFFHKIKGEENKDDIKKNGHGTCDDCCWGEKGEQGCNVDRDSEQCNKNRRPREVIINNE